MCRFFYTCKTCEVFKTSQVLQVALYKIPAIIFNQITGLPELFFYFIVATGGFGRVGKVVVKLLCLTGENGATFFGMVAYGNDIIERNMPVLLHIVGSMVRYIDAIFQHGGYGAGVKAMGCYAGTVNDGFAIGKMPQVGFGHLAAATVAGAEHQDYFGFHFLSLYE